MIELDNENRVKTDLIKLKDQKIKELEDKLSHTYNVVKKLEDETIGLQKRVEVRSKISVDRKNRNI